MRGQALLHACIVTSGCTERAHIYTLRTNRWLHFSGTWWDARYISGEVACRGGHSGCMHGLQGTHITRAHVAHGLWIMHFKQGGTRAGGAAASVCIRVKWATHAVGAAAYVYTV
eukprot:1193722-Prorocentrum_minimum.AAC.1